MLQTIKMLMRMSLWLSYPVSIVKN